MAWILLGALIVSGIFFLMVLKQVLGTEERLRLLVVESETRISKRYNAKLVPPGSEQGEQGEAP
jgi:Mg2+/citrate symporter